MQRSRKASLLFVKLTTVCYNCDSLCVTAIKELDAVFQIQKRVLLSLFFAGLCLCTPAWATAVEYDEASGVQQNSVTFKDSAGTESSAVTLKNAAANLGTGHNITVTDYSKKNISVFGYNNTVTASNSTVIGSNSVATMSDSVVIGKCAQATGSSSMDAYAIVIGAGRSSSSASTYTEATNSNAIAIGSSDGATANAAKKKHTYASGAQSTAIGFNTTASGLYSTSLGSLSAAMANYAAALGYNANASGAYSVSVSGVAEAEKSVAVGYNAVTSHKNSVALGANSATSAENEISVGNSTLQRKITNVASAGDISLDANKYNALNAADLKTEVRVAADGKYIKASNTAAANISALDTAIDSINSSVSNKADKATTLAGYGITDAYSKSDVDSKVSALDARIDTIAAKGTEAVASKQADPSSDKAATSTGAGSVASGYNSLSSGAKSIATGYNSVAEGENAVAVGVGATATGTNSIAIGTGHTVSGNNSGALGDPSTITGNNSYAIGNNNQIAGDNNFVLGNNVKIQDRNITNSVALGNNSEVTESNTVSVGSAAQQRKIVNVANGNIAEGSKDAVTGGQLYETNQVVNNIQNNLNSVGTQIKEVGAISAALAGLHYAEPSGDEGDKLTGAVAYGGYRGENAAAIGVAYKPSSNLMLSASTSVGNSQNAYNAGISYKFGKGNTAAARTSLQKQLKYLSDRNKQQDETIATQNQKIEELTKAVQELQKLIKK